MSVRHKTVVKSFLLIATFFSASVFAISGVPGFHIITGECKQNFGIPMCIAPTTITLDKETKAGLVGSSISSNELIINASGFHPYSLWCGGRGKVSPLWTGSRMGRDWNCAEGYQKSH